MNRTWAVAVVTGAALVAVAGCRSGPIFSTEPSTMFALLPNDVPSKVVTLEVICSRGRLTVDSATVEIIERMPGVYAVRLGSQANTVNVLVDDIVRPESLAERLEPSCRGRVLGVVNRTAQ
jgi:hypothetical protein